jgi:Fic family protein
MREYESTHAWIKFSLSLKDAPWELWQLLGEACSKCEHIAGVPLTTDYAMRLNQISLVRGALATTAIEGNTLSEAEGELLAEGKLRLPQSREYQAEEVKNILDACNELVTQVQRDQIPPLSPKLIAEYNGKVLRGLPPEDGAIPGVVRRHSVGIPGVNYRGAPFEDCDFLLDRLCTWLNEWEHDGPGSPLFLSVLKAVIAHLYIAWIHPFGNGNGRTARLVEVHILLSAGVPMPAAHLLSNHYNRTRPEYYSQLVRASQSGGDVLPFLLYAVRGFVEGLRGQVALIREQQWTVAWEHFVHERFGNEHGPTAERRRHLVLDLSNRFGPVSRGALRELSPRVAAAYATKTEMTRTRDLNALQKMGLVERTKDGWRARREIVLAFLPPQKP